MPTLRLRQFAEGEGENRHRVLVEMESEDMRRTAESRFHFELGARDRGDLRWYLEDYLKYPLDPAPKIARRIEERMAAIGVELFRKVLENKPPWTEVRHKLSDTRIEIVTGVEEATTIPWELLRDPDSNVPLALRARAFVRAAYNAVQRPSPGQSTGGRIRVLRQAKAAREPYHVVHFDGHGGWSRNGLREGGHGYLLFENPALEENREPVDGSTLGSLLADTGVAVLTLNACQSHYAEPPSEPVPARPDNPHEETRAFGSLAQEVMDAGASGVVAMRYSVLVEAAARFTADLYDRFIQGDALGDAAGFARKQLHTQPLRGAGVGPLPLQDWMVPVVFEAAPVTLFPRREGVVKLTLKPRKHAGATVEGLPPRPDAGFFGRDETLLALDRAFDTQPIVLLHAYAGSGKTAAAAEFARWYRDTGGVEAGRVLFTSFEQHTPLVRVLDQLGQVFGPELEQTGVHWLAKNEAERREIAIEVLKRKPVLWIWDNVEPVHGFPKGSESKWKPEEQLELANFLRAARETKAKFLLTSRREERDWLAELPARIPLPPMRFEESVELTRKLAEKRGRRLTDVEDWRPLLKFTQGNPLAITVIVGQALRDGLRTREQVEAFAARLGAGEAAFEDEQAEGRTRSLAASLNYGFKNAFNEDERRQLAVLFLFQGFVDVDVLCGMGRPEREWGGVAELRGLERDAGVRLLDRAADVGLLTGQGGGHYSIHPALPWFFRRLFEEHYGGSRESAQRAFAEAMASVGNYYAKQYVDGKRDVIGVLKAEEPNLLHARVLARRHGWWNAVIGAMQGLRPLYAHTGRGAEWARLVEEMVPDFIDPATEGPLAGREEAWSIVTSYRVGLAQEARRWDEAERLQSIRVDWARRQAREEFPKSVRSLAISLQDLGGILLETGRPGCVETYEESFVLARKISDDPLAQAAAFALGHAYLYLRDLRDLDKAERWYRKSLELVTKGDRMARAGPIGQLGRVAFERSEDARKSDKPEAVVLGFVNEALRLYHQALELTPPDAINQLATAHGQLGNVYGLAGDIDRALEHYQESIRLEEQQNNLYRAAQTRYNVAIDLARAGRFSDAREYALAALRNFETLGAREQVQKTLDLLSQIAKAAGGASGAGG